MFAIVVDDDAEIRDDVTALFPLGDVTECVSFSSRAEFEAELSGWKASHRLPCLFLLDVRMEENDSGLKILRSLRAAKRLKRIPIVMISQSDDEADVKSAYDDGANYYVVKGTDPVQLSETLNKMLANGKVPRVV